MKRLSLAAIVIVTMCLFACKHGQIDLPVPDVGPESLTKIQQESVEQINDFAFNLAEQINETVPNEGFVCSPMSMAYLLGMLCEGASGETYKEICAALGMNLDDKKALNDLLHAVMLISAKGVDAEEVLEVSNLSVVNHDFNVLDRYKESIKAYYDADVVSLNFTDSDYVAGYINDWTAQKTHGRILDIAAEIDPDTRAMFLNAIYFKAGWADGFYSDHTHKSDFTTEDGNQSIVDLMHKTADMAYFKGNDYSILELPYGRTDENNNIIQGNYSMYLILPAEGVGVREVLEKFDSHVWKGVRSALTSKTVDLQLPRFEVGFNLEMNDILRSLGINRMFGPGADFSAMSGEDVFVTLVKQAANISVDEKGSEASSVSIALMGTAASPDLDMVEFHCTRPFIFAVTEKQTDSILFMGCYRG